MTNKQATIITTDAPVTARLGLRAGDLVEVRSQDEILATLDENGTLDAMPFMPEMLEFCGQRLRVYKRADKTCDFVEGWSLRRITDTVHLEDNRCSGAAHGGCQAACLTFWKEAWLKRVDPSASATPDEESRAALRAKSIEKRRCTPGGLCAAAERKVGDDMVFVCQMTELKKYTTMLHWWDVRHYVRDIRSGNLDRGFGGSKSERIVELLLATWEAAGQLMLTAFNGLQKIRRHVEYPSVAGRLKSTPSAVLNLQPGDIVQVKSREEIMQTLDRDKKNRGLLFDAEMLRYCGGMFKVLRRVERIVHEKTGRLIRMPKDCIILEGVFCKADFHMSCPRSIYPYWREIWLTKVGRADEAGMVASARTGGAALLDGAALGCDSGACEKRLPMLVTPTTNVTH